MLKYFITFENCKFPLKILGYKFLERINLNKIIILDYFK